MNLSGSFFPKDMASRKWWFLCFYKINFQGTSLAVQWLRLRASTAGGAGSIPGRGTKIPHVVRHSQKKKR